MDARRNVQSRPFASAPAPCARGFSAVELLLVLVLLGVGGLVVLPAIDRSLNVSEVKKAALGLAATARNLRGRALQEGLAQHLILDAAGNSYEVRGGKKVYLADAVRFAAIRGGEPGESQERRFVFFPNGTVSGGVVAVQGRVTDALYSVHLETLSGRVFVEEG